MRQFAILIAAFLSASWGAVADDFRERSYMVGFIIAAQSICKTVNVPKPLMRKTLRAILPGDPDFESFANGNNAAYQQGKARSCDLLKKILDENN